MNRQEYEQMFTGAMPGGDSCALKVDKAFNVASDIRKFQIEMYWRRATYFWTLLGVIFAGYGFAYKESTYDNSWLLLVLSSLGLVFSIAWYLVNCGSKFWQNNWEHHIDLLENQVTGPLYKIIVEDVGSKNPLVASYQYSGSAINQILSVFISLVWLILNIKSIGPISCSLRLDCFKLAIFGVTFLAIVCLLYYGRSKNWKVKEIKLSKRTVIVEGEMGELKPKVQRPRDQ